MAQPDDHSALSPPTKQHLDLLGLSVSDYYSLKPSRPDPNSPGFNHCVPMEPALQHDMPDLVSVYSKDALTISVPKKHQYSHSQWESMRPILTYLYKEQGFPLKKVMVIMSENYGFHAEYVWTLTNCKTQMITVFADDICTHYGLTNGNCSRMRRLKTNTTP